MDSILDGTEQEPPQTVHKPQPGDPGRDWHIHRVAQQIETSELLASAEGLQKYGSLCADTAQVVRGWASRFAGEPAWRSFLNKKSMVHELEEAIMALQILDEYTTGDPTGQMGQLVVVDLCCGKGTFSVLLSYLAAIRPALRACVQKTVMVEK